MPDCSIFFEPCFTLVYCWQYSAICWSIAFDSFYYLFTILCQISASFAETNPWTKIKHLKLSTLNSAILKSLQCLLTTAAKVVKSSCSFLFKLKHFHLLWNSDVLRENSSVKMFTISVNCSSQVFRVKYSLQILNVLMCQVYSKGVSLSSSQSNPYNLY